MRLVAVRVERAAQAERPVGVTAGGDGGQPEGSVRLPRAHPHDVGVVSPWRFRRVSAAAAVAGSRAAARRRAFQP